MIERVTSDTLLAKALRIALVFTLVFWSSFNVETLAFAAMTADSAAHHDAGTLSDLDVWEVDKSDSQRVANFVRDVRDTASDQKQTTAVSVEVGGSTSFVAVPAWASAPSEPDAGGDSGDSGEGGDGGEGGADEGEGGNPGDGSGGGTPDDSGGSGGEGGDADGSGEGGGAEDDAGDVGSGNAADSAADAEELATQASAEGSFWLPRAYADETPLATQADGVSDSPVPTAPDDVVVADFVEWKVSDESVASLKAEGGAVTLTGLASGTVTVTCSLKPEAANLPVASFAAEFPEKPFEASFTATVASKSAPYVQSIEVYKPDADPTTPLSENEEVVLSDDDRASYKVRLKVNTYDPSSESEELVSYEFTTPKGLKEASGGRFDDLVWEPLNPDESAASEDDITVQDGVITLKGDGPITVKCTSLQGKDGQPYSTRFVVRSSAAPDPQGVANPQNKLTVTIDVPGSEESPEGGGAETPGSDSPSVVDESANANANGADDDGSISTQAEGDDAPDASAGDEPANADDETGESTAAPEKAATLKSTSATYEYPDMANIPEIEFFDVRTVRDQNPYYAMSSPDGQLKVEGRGPTLAALIYHTADPDGALGLSPNANPIDIDSVEFIIAGGKSVTVPWSDLVSVSAPNNVILAAESRVMVDDAQKAADGGEGESKSGSADELLPNTRFRLLYNGSGKGELADPDAFRWISGVVVHVKGEKAADPEPVDTTKPHVAYTPVRKGEVAYLIPQFTLPDSINGGGIQFSYEWQWSTDDATWQSIESAYETDKDRGQQLEVLTNDTSLGTFRRFVLNISQIDGATGEETTQSIESTSVMIEEGSGFRVKLDYVPPIAGDVANFTAIPVIDPDDAEMVDVSQIYYEWQMSTDYGQTWVGEDSADWPDLLRQQSGVQATTLRIPTQAVDTSTAAGEGEDGSSDEPEQSETQITWIRVVAHFNGRTVPSDPAPLTVHVGDTSGGKKADEIQEALDAGAETDDTDDSPRDEQAPAQPSQTRVTELDSIVFEQQSTTTGSGPQPSPTPSQVYVNDAVAEQISEQRQAEEEQAKSQPGARWTELSSVNPTDEDVQNILLVNPLAPFAAPLALGVTAAGAVEKIVGFRRQTR